MLEASSVARRTEEACIVQRDWRADGGLRRVRVTPREILISRRFNGVNMMIAVPAPAYYGVSLDVAEGQDGAPCYRLSLIHRDHDLDVVLAETQDSVDAAVDWKYWSNWLGLPRLAATNGQLVRVDAAHAPPTAFPRRGASSVRRRRPRFLTRRKLGMAARMAEVFSGEREIICYE
ncbi:MAG: DUF6101 family protein [Methylocystis sp.]|jgi:hypothetical protein